jgi:type II secretory pathway predicted ATPase ExeA
VQTISPQRRRDIVDALRRGTVPASGLALLAVGLSRFETAVDEELDAVEHGSGVFKAVRGEYGSGKTFFARWLQEPARKRGMASAEVQISETETPLHRLETVYRRLVERLATDDAPQAALRSVIDRWFFALEQDALAEGNVAEDDTDALLRRVGELLDSRLGTVSKSAPAFAAALRAIRTAQLKGDITTADGLLAWIAGQPNVSAVVKGRAGIKGDLDHFGALAFLQGLLVVLRDAGHRGLVLVLDEVETLQRVRSDVREKALNALRQILDEVDGGRFPGLYVLVTGTPAFFEGPQGIQRLPPLAQRLHVDFATDGRFDNPRAVQVRLKNFDHDALVEVGTRVRDIYAQHMGRGDRIRSVVDDSYVADLATAVAGALGGKVGIAPRVFLKKLVADVLDRVDQFPDFDPRRDYAITVARQDLTPAERAAVSGSSPDDVELDV